MNDELATIAGRYEEHVGKLQEEYGIAKEEAGKQVDEYKKIVEQLRKSNNELDRLQRLMHKKEASAGRAISGRMTMTKTTRRNSRSRLIRSSQ
jgi:hypothetical protein